MANTIKPKRSNTASKVPNTSELVSGELGVNMADKKIYINNGTSVVQVGAGVLSALGDVTISSPTNGQSLSYNGTAWVNATGAGTGTVTSVSVVSANGLAGTVATATSTPAITLTTTVTGLVKGNGTALSAATSGTDYSAGTAALGTGIVKSTTTTGALTIAVAGDFPTLNQNTTGTSANVTGTVAIGNGGTGATSAATALTALGAYPSSNPSGYTSNTGTVTSVTGTAPVVSSGGATPAISMAAATTSVNGYLTSTDWNTFNGKQAALGFTPYNATNPSNYIALASAITGYTVGTNTALAATDTLLAGLGKIQGQINARGTGNGTVTSVSGTAPISVATGTTTPAITIAQATTSTGGYLSSTDWNTFNGKQAAGSYVTVGGALGTPSSGTLTNCTFPTLNQNTTGSSGSCTGNAATATTAGGLTGTPAITVAAIGCTTITASGAITSTSTITSGFSDDRLKTRHGKIENALDKVQSLDGFYYTPNDVAQALGYQAIQNVGVSAQSVQAIMPEIVFSAPIDDKYLTVHYEKLVPLLIEAIKELKTEIDQLKIKA